MRTVSIILIFLLIGVKANAQMGFELRYLGNMGVAIIHDDSAIIIDGLHDFYTPDYLPTDTNTLKSILKKEYPFTNIVVIGFTHRHHDHFDSSLVTSAVNIHSQSRLLGGEQVKALLDKFYQSRFLPFSENNAIEINPNLLIRLRKIPHINPIRHAAVDNYRIEIRWNEFYIIHLGDAAIVPQASAQIEGVPDVMIVPQWFLTNEGIDLLAEIKPKNILVTHISPQDSGIIKNEKLKSPAIAFKNYNDKFIFRSN